MHVQCLSIALQFLAGYILVPKGEEFVVVRIKAKEILNKACESSWCNEALEFYDSRNISGDIILEKGSADFDKKIGKNGEKAWYRAAYYAGDLGYMKMHIRQNRTAFMHHRIVKHLLSKKTLFVDFGCGPMTSGVMLADTLSESMPDYKNQVIYVGIDVSQNMCEIAERVNTIEVDSHIFEKSYILNNDTLDLRELDRIVLEQFQPDVSVLSLSYVLAPDTYNGDHTATIELAQKWRSFNRQLDSCRESYIIYMNPKFMVAHKNWDCIVQKYKNVSPRDWKYEVSERKSVPVEGLQKPVITQMISGKKRSQDVAYT